MGAEPWDYFVPYEGDVQAALEKLREREFRAGRFNGAEFRPATIDEAREVADADGTRSILDIDRVGDEPDFGVVVPLPAATLIELYGTDRPSRAMIEANPDFFEDIERGQGVSIIVYEGDRPSEIYFGGYSYD
ncbi:MAG TPA: hypothetical protein VG406_15055 [Isosphaeraceae bacterium]|jgi:hypothetical protein|nr:hypothetical protein [Isosphaeraceae bacterium]